ncbi:cytochrome c [bacterium]|nr:cytochrome c [bacterium]
MKNNRIITKVLLTGAFASVVLSSCGDPNSPGLEYMPDMYRSPAIETYVDYEYPDSMSARLPVENTIPRGYKPYPFANTIEGYEEAGQKLAIPFKVTDEMLVKGGALYASFCQHCHGTKGQGKGSINHPAYSAVPSYTDENKTRRGGRSMSELAPGHIYHTIMYGLNAMGPHAAQLNDEERWLIVAYVQKLQGKNPEAMKEVAAEEIPNETNETAETVAE